MSSLMVSNDLDIMMLEFAVEKLYIPKKSVFDTVIMKKTTVLFRMLDSDWIAVNPYRTDYVPYKGSNREELDFHGGKSVVFAIPTGSLETRMKGVDIQINVINEVSKYFEANPTLSRQNVGVALANVDCLFNGIIKDLREREQLKEYLNGFHKRQPISRSLKETYAILDEDRCKTGATVGIYVRLSYFGKSVITEIDRDRGSRPNFYVQEETNETSPYQCRELKQSELASGCWGSETFLPPVNAERLTCRCDEWNVTDADETTGKPEGKGNRDSETSANLEKRGRKTSGDHSQVRTMSKVNKSVGKTEKPIRKTKSADEEVRKTTKKTTSGRPSRTSKTLETNETTSNQKHRTSVTTKSKKMESGDSKSTNDYAKLLEQLRKRRRGVVTVGIDDKKKNKCPESTMMPPRPCGTCTKQFGSTSPNYCPNLGYDSSYCHSRYFGCDGHSISTNRGCFVESRNRRPEDFCASLYRRNFPEMQIIAN